MEDKLRLYVHAFDIQSQAMRIRAESTKPAPNMSDIKFWANRIQVALDIITEELIAYDNRRTMEQGELAEVPSEQNSAAE